MSSVGLSLLETVGCSSDSWISKLFFSGNYAISRERDGDVVSSVHVPTVAYRLTTEMPLNCLDVEVLERALDAACALRCNTHTRRKDGKNLYVNHALAVGSIVGKATHDGDIPVVALLYLCTPWEKGENNFLKPYVENIYKSSRGPSFNRVMYSLASLVSYRVSADDSFFGELRANRRQKLKDTGLAVQAMIAVNSVIKLEGMIVAEEVHLHASSAKLGLKHPFACQIAMVEMVSEVLEESACNVPLHPQTADFIAGLLTHLNDLVEKASRLPSATAVM